MSRCVVMALDSDIRFSGSDSYGIKPARLNTVDRVKAVGFAMFQKSVILITLPS